MTDVNQKTSSEYVLDTSREYSIYVCESRSIPKVADGLKDGQRKMLWVMRNRADKIKTVALSGEVIALGLYLHGDMSASETISMMCAPYCNNVPLLNGIGTFGTRVAPTGWAAARYTYCKKGKATQELILSDLPIIPLKENYDGSTQEPVNFLPLIPMVLLNGVSGIAVGWSTEILPRSLKDIIESTILALDDKKFKRLTPAYDYLTCKVNHLIDNTWEFTGQVEILDTSTVCIKELPPDLTLEKFKERLNVMEDENLISGYTDRSTKTINITVKIPRITLKDKTEIDLIDFFKLKQKKTERIVVIGWNGKSIMQYQSAELLIEDFVKWRLEWFTKRYQKMLDDDSYELRFWKAMKACFDGDLPKNLSKKQNRQEIEQEVTKLTVKINLDGKQMDKIVSVPTYRWALDEYNNVLKKIKDLEESIEIYKNILSDPEKIRSIYREELINLKKLKF
jgi:DNA gyrase/topoisomerase IV subunit A